MKRLRAAVASDGAYHEIGFSYESIESSDGQMQQNFNKDEEPNEEPYLPPDGLTLPKGIQAPSNMKIHAIIEKTAVFISQQGGQMEIIIKMKQSDNPQFAFMSFDNPLHPYYKFLVQELKAGRYKPPPDKNRRNSEDEHHDGHYLHPSLVSRKTEAVPKFTVPSISFRKTGDDSYSLLVKTLKQRIVEDAHRHSSSQAETGTGSHNSTSDTDESLEGEDYTTSTSIVPPPPDIQPIIDKMAEYVAKNGEDFETIVKSKNDRRFQFLNQGHKYYNYYMYRRNLVARPSPVVVIEPEKPEPEPTQSPLPSSPQVEPVMTESPSLSPDHSKISSSIADLENVQVQISSNTNLSSAEQSPRYEENCEPDTTDTFKSSRSGSASPSEEFKEKAAIKVTKGPISFSLKGKELESQSFEKPAKRALLDDSEGEDENNRDDSISDADKRSRSSKDQDVTTSSRSKKTQASDEEKPKKPTAEELEAKLAEEKIKAKLMAAAREKLVQNKRDKQLQLERKQKAALFLQMLQKKQVAAVAEMTEAAKMGNNKNNLINPSIDSPMTKNGSLYLSPTVSDITSPGRKQPLTSFPPSPLPSTYPGTQWSSPSNTNSDVSDNEAAVTLAINERLIVTTQVVPQVKEVVPKKKEKEREKEKEKVSLNSTDKSSKSHRSKSSHKSSKSKKRKRSRSRSSTHRHQRPKSPSRKEKKLPSAYAIERKSRSKSRSPKRYSLHSRPRSPLHWPRFRP